MPSQESCAKRPSRHKKSLRRKSGPEPLPCSLGKAGAELLPQLAFDAFVSAPPRSSPSTPQTMRCASPKSLFIFGFPSGSGHSLAGCFTELLNKNRSRSMTGDAAQGQEVARCPGRCPGWTHTFRASWPFVPPSQPQMPPGRRTVGGEDTGPNKPLCPRRYSDGSRSTRGTKPNRAPPETPL